MRNGTFTLGWYTCGVLSCPGGVKGVVRVEVVEKLAPQLPDDRANGPAKKQLVSSADGASFTRSLVLAQTAAKALAAQTAGPRKRRQPSCWADEAESGSEETESAPEKKQRSMPTAPVRARAATFSLWPNGPPRQHPNTQRHTLSTQPLPLPLWQSRTHSGPARSKPAATTAAEALPQAGDAGLELPQASCQPGSASSTPAAMTAAAAATVWAAAGRL